VSVQEPQEKRKASSVGIYIEDGLILVSIVLLFWITVFHRHERVGQILLIVLLVVMLVVFVWRIRRVHRAFRNGSQPPDTL
jgi:L-asparagine transporter-like permease